MDKKTLAIALVIALALALALSLGGCGSKDKAGGKSESLDAPSEASGGGDGSAGFNEAGNWPDNEFTKQVPNPGFGTGNIYSDENELSTTFEDITMDEARKYGEKLKAAGFTENLDVYDTDDLASVIKADPEFADLTDEEIAEYLDNTDLEELGMKPMYTFEAGNGAGYSVKLFWYEDAETTFKIVKE